jgi:alkaline phosphatase D
MNRRDLMKALGAAVVSPTALIGRPGLLPSPQNAFASAWQDWPDMPWTGPEYWGNRLQDWRVASGRVECLVAGRNRTLHCLTARVEAGTGDFSLTVVVERPLTSARRVSVDCLGFRIGAKGPRDDYRSAAVYGRGLDAGLTGDGRLRIGERLGADVLEGRGRVRLTLSVQRRGVTCRVTLVATDPATGRSLASVSVDNVGRDSVVGTLALLAHVDAADETTATPVARFDRWEIAGDGVVQDAGAVFGPVCFAQYTRQRGTLKLTAQLTPVETIEGRRVTLDVRTDGAWRTVDERPVDPLSRTAQFRVDRWSYETDVPYRVRLSLPLRSGVRHFDYEGTIAAEPVAAPTLTVACFSCNADHGFPDADVVRHVEQHRPHLAVFLGDQFYESQGGFGIQTSPIDKACLDYLRKWYMFGWSYRDIFRHRPAAFIPDDHDVYHGNIWGEGGIHAPTDHGWGYAAQDQGGYKMPAAWVNALQQSQTSHLPDPYDPTPAAQGIGVYYTAWNYAGVSFAILEDRKFKSAPGHVLPKSAKVVNGFATDPAFDPTQHRNPPGAHLLGARQLAFLDEWAADWEDAEFKVVLSQTPFCAVHTLPAGSTNDEMVPGLPIPPPGAYVTGDAPARDMDTNGWPQDRRDEALRRLRKGLAFHIAGDQHLASIVHYGVDRFADASFAFTVPALNNIWPRRWWPPLPDGHLPLPDAPSYTGDFLDAFGNRVTVCAAANPRRTDREPAIIHDRATGYGMVVFDKAARTIRIECWPRYADPLTGPGQQYTGWPMTVHQSSNYPRRGDFVVPELRVIGLADPVLQFVAESTDEIAYTLRIKGTTFAADVPTAGPYTVRVGDGRRWLRVLTGIMAEPSGMARPAIVVDLGA